MKEISVLDIGNVFIGNAADKEGATGVTVIVCPDGAACGVDIRGGGPASRETHLLNPLSAAEKIHAVVLSGGSAFGLDCAGGVMEYLENQGIGFDTGITKVPLVCTSCIYDLICGDYRCRPQKKMGFEATANAFEGKPLLWGNEGAGTGATVGKLAGPEFALKSGLGSFALQIGELKVGAVVAVNALGDIYENGRILAGMLSAEGDFADSTKVLYQSLAPKGNLFTGNTTIGAVITNAEFTKSEMNKIAAMASNAYARAIRPVNTTADGDSLYAMSVGTVKADINVVGTLAADVMEKAIVNAVKEATSDYGFKAVRDL